MYDFTVSTPANTTKASPQRTELALRKGIITQVHIAFPPGPQGLLHVILERAGSLLWPENEGDGFVTDNFTVIFSPLYDLEAEPFSLTAITYNEDDLYAHQVGLRFEIIAPDLAFPQAAQVSLLTRLTDRLFKR